MCWLELALTVWGIVTLCRGEFPLFGGKVVRGVPAYLVGGLLTAILPILIGIGIVIGIMLVAQGVPAQQLQARGNEYWWLDLIVVPIFLVITLVIAFVNAEDPPPTQLYNPYAPQQFPPPGPQYPPMDPNNPYASPRATNPYGDGYQPPMGPPGGPPIGPPR